MPVTRPEKCAVLACELIATVSRAMPTTSMATPLSKEAKGQNKGFTKISGKRGVTGKRLTLRPPTGQRGGNTLHGAMTRHLRLCG